MAFRCADVDRFASLAPMLSRGGSPFCDDVVVDPSMTDAENAAEALAALREDKRILVVGAGGLGCEALRQLVLSNFADVTVVDLDTVDTSNLNRQSLFDRSSVGKYKCEAAAAFVQRRRPDTADADEDEERSPLKIDTYTRRIQTFGRGWFSRFDAVSACLDNEEARLWLNAALVDNVRYADDKPTADSAKRLREERVFAEGVSARLLARADESTVVPLADGGTEGWAGQARLILPGVSYCLQCSAATAPPAAAAHFHLCTVAHVPRTPEHCVMHAHLLQWPRLTRLSQTDADDYELAPEGAGAGAGGAVELDADNELHATWLWRRAVERARAYGLTEPTYALTLAVVKGIIPAIASTNALIAAAASVELLKRVGACGPRLKDYWLYKGDTYATGANCQTYPYQRDPDCAACHARTLLTVPRAATVGAVLAALRECFSLERVSVLNVRADTATVMHAEAAAVADTPACDTFKAGELYLATGPGRAARKFQVAFVEA